MNMVDASCTLFRGNVSSLSAYTILFYDHFLTLPMEIDRYWCAGSHTWASALFLAIRYVALLGHVPLLYRIFGDPCEVMRITPLMASYHSILVLFLTVLTSALLIMRVYALYFRNRWILFIVTLEFTAGFLLACWTLSKLLPGLEATYTRRRARLQGVAFSGLLVFDLTVFVLTMARSIKLWTHKEPFLKRIFIDGLLYYGVIWNLNLVNVIVLFVTNPDVDFSTPVFTNVLSVVMITRLMINLRDPTILSPVDGDVTVTTSYVGYVSTLVPDGTYSRMLATQTKSIPSQSAV
ncbi:hypothetical protein BGY98DRAFT_523784 [Russula aff. rugulosa BPL654]|nr:hypothetical protein BGY98DRAFT_523784 [Russula aff. rugulosa BPL654]